VWTGGHSGPASLTKARHNPGQRPQKQARRLLKCLSSSFLMLCGLRRPLPICIRWVCGRWGSWREKEIRLMAVTEQGREDRLPSVVMPGARGLIDVARVPREVAQDELCRRRPGDFCGLDRT